MQWIRTYTTLPEELTDIPTVSASLRESLQALSDNRDFLKKGDVFTDDQIDAYIALRLEDANKVDHTPSPVEFQLYYSV